MASDDITRILRDVSSFYPEKTFTELLLELNINMRVETYGGTDGYQQLTTLRDNTGEKDNIILNRIKSSDSYRKMMDALEARNQKV
jgi:hypothetical protein